jgi:hypothetical protein
MPVVGDQRCDTLVSLESGYVAFVDKGVLNAIIPQQFRQPERYIASRYIDRLRPTLAHATLRSSTFG